MKLCNFSGFVNFYLNISPFSREQFWFVLKINKGLSKGKPIIIALNSPANVFFFPKTTRNHIISSCILWKGEKLTLIYEVSVKSFILISSTRFCERAVQQKRTDQARPALSCRCAWAKPKLSNPILRLILKVVNISP